MNDHPTPPGAPASGQMTPAARERVLADLTDGHDATNPTFLYSTTATALLLAIAAGLIDPVALARQQLAARGLDRDGAWAGFARAKQIHLGDSASVGCAASSEATGVAVATEIAKRHLQVETLETRNSDSQDFHDLAVWNIRTALIAAYNAGAHADAHRADGNAS